jgi:hypothetical protein
VTEIVEDDDLAAGDIGMESVRRLGRDEAIMGAP